MSGIEVAGLALAVFPVLVNGLNQLIAGIETIHRWKRYRDRLKEYATKLESALAWFQDTLDELLGDIVPSDEEIKLMLREPGGKMWKRPEYEEKLRARLDRSYNSYQRSIEQLVRDIRVMSENLGVENGALVCAEPELYPYSGINAAFPTSERERRMESERENPKMLPCHIVPHEEHRFIFELAYQNRS